MLKEKLHSCHNLLSKSSNIVTPNYCCQSQGTTQRSILSKGICHLRNGKELGQVNFRTDFWDCYWDKEKNWPMADRRVPSHDPRNHCRKNFGSSSLLVSKRCQYSCPQAHSNGHEKKKERQSFYSPRASSPFEHNIRRSDTRQQLRKQVACLQLTQILGT